MLFNKSGFLSDGSSKFKFPLYCDSCFWRLRAIVEVVNGWYTPGLSLLLWGENESTLVVRRRTGNHTNDVDRPPFPRSSPQTIFSQSSPSPIGIFNYITLESNSDQEGLRFSSSSFLTLTNVTPNHLTERVPRGMVRSLSSVVGKNGQSSVTKGFSDKTHNFSTFVTLIGFVITLLIK